ncbi:hypothetical protein UCREL1_3161 [Eutypa lata UCREL1]|uniref:Eisosome protein 1 protein n=1 Tax=Eutypa lata (strain UCR-EL1) TaxID=1287681 RepID=M7SZQ8_EUTLA|nr:hypothetical protein UCREL1_3161 [Eutypa lata UCREL1]
MAKKMYTQQQKIIDAKKSQVEAAPARGRRGSLSNVSDDGQPAHITTLQDAAYKQAQKRLAKLHQGNLKTLEYQEYYGAGNLQKRFTIRNKLRRRASSDSAVIDDQTRSQQIRQQMSIFSNKLSEVDDKKRQQDRDALLAVAHRNVQARLKSMDEKISAETGMVPPSTLTQWELKAHTAAQTRSDARVDKNAGKVDVGAGLRLDQDAIDAIAARRVQPLLDEINEKAEEEHAKQLQLKLEMERKKEEEEIEKARQKEIHEINRKLKGKWAEEKQEARAKREQEKAVKAEMKRMAKTEKHGASPDLPREDHQEEPTTAAAGQIVVMNTNNQPVSIPRPTTPTTSARHIQDEDDTEPDPASKSSPRGGGKVKTWFKSHFSKPSRSSDEEKPDNNNNGRGFVGGAALTGMDGNDSSTSLGNRSASMRAMALAGRDSQNRERATSSLRGSAVGDNDGGDGDMSSLSSSSDDDDDNDRRRRHRFSDQQPTTGLSPPREVRNFSNQNHSPARDSRFREMM